MSPLKDEEIQVLVDLGLTFRQAKVYLTLVWLGESTAKTLSKYSHVHRQDIYRILSSLENMGLIVKGLTTPTRWNASPIGDGLSILVEQKNNELLNLHKKTLTLFNSLREKDKENVQEATPFFVTANKESLVRQAKKEFEANQLSNDGITTMKHFNYSIQFDESIKKALKRGVKFRRVLIKPENEKLSLKIDGIYKNNPNFQIKYVSSPPLATLAIFDNSVVVISTSSINPHSMPFIWSRNPTFIETIRNYFELLWRTAIEIKK